MRRLWLWLDQVGYQVGCLLNVMRGGREDTTLSLAAARAQRREQASGRHGWGCYLCRWLSWTVERHHCTKQVEGRSVVRWGAVLAGVQLAVVFWVVFYGLPWALGYVW